VTGGTVEARKNVMGEPGGLKMREKRNIKPSQLGGRKDSWGGGLGDGGGSVKTKENVKKNSRRGNSREDGVYLRWKTRGWLGRDGGVPTYRSPRPD